MPIHYCPSGECAMAVSGSVVVVTVEQRLVVPVVDTYRFLFVDYNNHTDTPHSMVVPVDHRRDTPKVDVHHHNSVAVRTIVAVLDVVVAIVVVVVAVVHASTLAGVFVVVVPDDVGNMHHYSVEDDADDDTILESVVDLLGMVLMVDCRPRTMVCDMDVVDVVAHSYRANPYDQ